MDISDYKLDNCKITHQELDNKPYRLISYEIHGVQFVIATDFLGTQICWNGNFFPNFCDFGSIENAVGYLRQDGNLKECEKFFRKTQEIIK